MALTVLAVGCAAMAVAVDGPVRFAAGLTLCLYLPGRLAVLAAAAGPTAPNRYLAWALTIPLSLVATAVVGLAVAASGQGFRPPLVAAGLLAWCLVLGGVAVLRGPGVSARPAVPASARPAVPRGAWWAGIPVLALTALLGWQLVAAAGHRSPDSYYTECAVEPGPDGAGVVVVHSHERGPVRFRLETRLDGVPNRSTGFSLRPGERQEFAVPGPRTGRVEAVLYRADGPAPYRRLTL